LVRARGGLRRAVADPGASVRERRVDRAGGRAAHGTVRVVLARPRAIAESVEAAALCTAVAALVLRILPRGAHGTRAVRLSRVRRVTRPAAAARLVAADTLGADPG